MERPKRAFTLTIELGADTWQQAIDELHFLADHIEEHGPDCKSVSGGCTAHHMVTIEHRPEMTNEAYMDEVKKYLEAKR